MKFLLMFAATPVRILLMFATALIAGAYELGYSNGEIAYQDRLTQLESAAGTISASGQIPTGAPVELPDSSGPISGTVTWTGIVASPPGPIASGPPSSAHAVDIAWSSTSGASTIAGCIQ